MSPPWKNIFDEVPNDGDIVWIVRIPFYDSPAQAKFDESNDGFHWTDSLGHDHTIPLWQIWKWRPL